MLLNVRAYITDDNAGPPSVFGFALYNIQVNRAHKL